MSWHGTQFSYIVYFVASLRVVDINQIGRKNLVIDKCDAKSVVCIYIFLDAKIQLCIFKIQDCLLLLLRLIKLLIYFTLQNPLWLIIKFLNFTHGNILSVYDSVFIDNFFTHNILDRKHSLAFFLSLISNSITKLINKKKYLPIILLTEIMLQKKFPARNITNACILWKVHCWMS